MERSLSIMKAFLPDLLDVEFSYTSECIHKAE